MASDPIRTALEACKTTPKLTHAAIVAFLRALPNMVLHGTPARIYGWQRTARPRRCRGALRWPRIRSERRISERSAAGETPGALRRGRMWK